MLHPVNVYNVNSVVNFGSSWRIPAFCGSMWFSFFLGKWNLTDSAALRQRGHCGHGWCFCFYQMKAWVELPELPDRLFSSVASPVWRLQICHPSCSQSRLTTAKCLSREKFNAAARSRNLLEYFCSRSRMGSSALTCLSFYTYHTECWLTYMSSWNIEGMWADFFLRIFALMIKQLKGTWGYPNS